MSTNKKKLRRIIENDNNKFIEEDFTSKYLPDSEEINLRIFAEKHKDMPLLKGAYSRCLNVGLISNYDSIRKSQLWKASIFHFISFQISCFLITRSLINYRLLISKANQWKVMLVTCGISGGIIAYNFIKINSELDRKYTPVWFKIKDVSSTNKIKE